VIGHVLTMTEITIGGKHCDGGPLRGGKMQGKPPCDPWDRSLVGDGSDR
jgi:hypothetical protein